MSTARVLAFVSKSSACSAYDCESVTLAYELQVPLVTSDGKMLAAFSGLAVSPEDFEE